ncbi:hypothetical protein V2I01_04260 [Micromonospora sp. BRA006-A]|nr:hypothetical protein [Micromonospora sp. BRA006-A]
MSGPAVAELVDLFGLGEHRAARVASSPAAPAASSTWPWRSSPSPPW